jgi:hypothetical protein
MSKFYVDIPFAATTINSRHLWGSIWKNTSVFDLVSYLSFQYLAMIGALYNQICAGLMIVLKMQLARIWCRRLLVVDYFSIIFLTQLVAILMCELCTPTMVSRWMLMGLYTAHNYDWFSAYGIQWLVALHLGLRHMHACMHACVYRCMLYSGSECGRKAALCTRTLFTGFF